MRLRHALLFLSIAPFLAAPCALAGEHLLGYTPSAETLPDGASDVYQSVTWRGDKGAGSYNAFDTLTEVEYGMTSSFQIGAGFRTETYAVKDIVVSGAIPGDDRCTLRPSGIQFDFQYNLLRPAVDPVGLSWGMALGAGWGGLKDKYEVHNILTLQKNLWDDQLFLFASADLETAYVKRNPLSDDRRASLPADFAWSTQAEMVVTPTLSAGTSWRFAPGWYAGLETQYQTVFKTGVNSSGRDHWTLFAGPTLHYGAQDWWCTLTWLPQIEGGGAKQIDGQPPGYHLIDRTRQEIRLKIGFNF